MSRIHQGETIQIQVGMAFNLLLPDGTLLEIEQTQDDFSITRMNGIVAYTKPTSDAAKADDKLRSNDLSETTGRN